jgi:CDP-6-deoxy-D-xylo-4-hexulose-3-dehydrase
MEISGAIGLEQLKKLDRMTEIRRRNAAVFQELFKGDERFIIQKENGKSSWFSFTVILNLEMKLNRCAIMNILKEHNIEHRIITGGNFLRHPAIKYYDYETLGAMKNADLAHDNGFFVGNFPDDGEERIRYFRKVIDKAARA